MQQNGDKNELLSVPGSNLFPCCIDATQLSEARCRGMDPRLHAVHDGAAMRAANTHDAHDKKDGGRGQCNFNTSTLYSQLTTPMYNNLTQPLLSFTRPKKKVGGNNHHEWITQHSTKMVLSTKTFPIIGGLVDVHAVRPRTFYLPLLWVIAAYSQFTDIYLPNNITLKSTVAKWKKKERKKEKKPSFSISKQTQN
jgi:hypothetical protein